MIEKNEREIVITIFKGDIWKFLNCQLLNTKI